MSKIAKILQLVLSGLADRNIAFSDLCKLLMRLGFIERTKGSHHIFTKNDIPDIINLQPLNNKQAKPYQVKQVRELLLKYQLHHNLNIQDNDTE